MFSKDKNTQALLINKTDLLEKSKSHAPIRKLPYKDKHPCNQRSQQENLQKSQIQQHQTQKLPQVESKRIYIKNLRKNSSEQDMVEFFGLRKTSYLSENCFIEMPTGRKMGNFKTYTFISAAEHVCN